MLVRSNGIPITIDADRFAPMRDSTALLGDAAALRIRFAEDGYVLLRGVLDRAKVMQLRGRYFAMFDSSYFLPETIPEAGLWSGTVPAGQSPHGVAGHPAHTLVRSPEFADFVGSPELAAVARILLAVEDVFPLPRQLVRHFHRGSLSSRAHTDRDYMDRGSDRFISMWLPIGDCPVQSGGLVYLEGSHRLPRNRINALKARRTDRPGDNRLISHDIEWTAQQLGGRWLHADYRAGDVVIHSPYLVHASLDAQTEMMRMSVDVRFQAHGVESDPRWLKPWSGDDGN